MRSASAAARTVIPNPIPAAEEGNARAGRAHAPRALSLTRGYLSHAAIPNPDAALSLTRRSL